MHGVVTWSVAAVGITGAAIALSGCGGKSGPNRPHAYDTRGGTAAGAATGTAGTNAYTFTGTTGSASPTTRLQPGDPGVQTGLRLLRSELSASEAAAAWATEGVTPEQAKSLLARLPLTAAPGPGTNQATIVDVYGRSTDLTVVVPASAAPAGGFPVLLCLHGLGGNSSNVTGLAQFAPNAIVVGPTAQKPPASVVFEDDAPIPLLNAFPHWWVYRDGAFAMRALDWVRERYPVDTNRIMLNGVSMGGFGANNLGLRYHDRFAGLATGAGGMSRREYALGRDTTTRSLLENAAMLPMWLAHGDADQVVPVRFSQWTSQDLTALGISHVYKEIAGAGHDKAAFTAIFPELAAWGAARVRNASPRQVKHRAIGDYHLGAYWVELKAAGTVSASASGSTISVTTSGPGATVYLDPALVDVSKPVTVTINGNTVQSGVVAPSLTAVARSFARTRDPKLTYCHMVGGN
jgi:predicted esterase